MHALIWILTGLCAGVLARVSMRRRSFGVVADAFFGLIGGAIGGLFLRRLGAVEPQAALPQFIVAFVGALFLLAVSRLVLRALHEAVALFPTRAEPLTREDLLNRFRTLGEVDQGVIARLLNRTPTTKDASASFDASLTFGERVADRVAAFGGSWSFIALFGGVLLVWIVINLELARPFDPYPFILLNLLLSCVAALQAPFIMMSQNRQSARDRSEARNDYEVNLRAEMQVERLHARLDELWAREWRGLMAVQEQQLEALRSLNRRGEGKTPESISGEPD